MSAIQGSGLEGCLQFRGLDYRGVCNSGVWITGVSAIQGSGLEGSTVYLQYTHVRMYMRVLFKCAVYVCMTVYIACLEVRMYVLVQMMRIQ